MKPEKRGGERRKHPRTMVRREESLIMIPKEGLVGSLIDISMGGVSFHYSGTRGCQPDVTHSCILFGHDDLWLEKVSLVTVRDVVVTYPLFQDRPCLRRRSMMFARLPDNAKTFLQQYIWLNAADLD